jgi:protein CpxP
MRKTFATPTAALLAALALPALSLSAFAQTPPAPVPTPPAQTAPAQTAPAKPALGSGPHARVANPQRARELTPAQRAHLVEQRIAKLHKDLGITPAQQPQWEPFAQVMRDNAQNMAKTFEQRGTKLAEMSAADNMQSYADTAAAHAQDIQHLATAFKSLYDSLSDSQKHTADVMFRHQPGDRGKS